MVNYFQPLVKRKKGRQVYRDLPAYGLLYYVPSKSFKTPFFSLFLPNLDSPATGGFWCCLSSEIGTANKSELPQMRNRP
jgi:hypothetical protein